MNFTEYQGLARRTQDGIDLLSFEQFCDRLKADGAYISEENHIEIKGKKLSRQCRNGYYMLRKTYDHHTYYFMEHRVIWYFVNGSIDENLVINHKDFDRTNNAIENLELITQTENVSYSKNAGRLNPKRGSESQKALLTEKDVQLIRYLCENGFSRKAVAKMMDAPNRVLIDRVVQGTCYGNVQNAASVLSIYPLLVEKTCRSDMAADEQIKNALLGLSGEVREVVDLFKKYFYQGHDIDINSLVEELGDVLYYLTWIMNVIDVNMAETAFENMDKLTERYPNGFDAERSVNRGQCNDT